MTLDALAQQLKDWIWRGKHASTSNFMITKEGDADHPFVRLIFVTVVNSYSIRAFLPSNDNDGGYLCCEYDARKPLPGETWTRGGDLFDGSLNEETWNKIMQDILSVELAEGVEVKV